MLIGAYFRFSEINWDENFHLHPDERFLTMVSTSISIEDSISDYLDTSSSSMNPYNVRDAIGNQTFPFFVYGTLPLFIVRIIAEWTQLSGYSQIHIIGRYLSGIFDLGSVLVVFLISEKLFKKKWLPLTATFLYACFVLPIQISHFFIVDHFATFFTGLAIYFALNIQLEPSYLARNNPSFKWKEAITNWHGFRYFGLFGIVLGLAAASKINSVLVAFLLPLAVLINIYKIPQDQRIKSVYINSTRYLLTTALISFLVFRFFQPYAFSGPGFINFKLNPNWIKNFQELGYLSSGNSNYPPSLQWARRSPFFPIKNLVIWGLGSPAGVSSLFGIVAMVWIFIRSKQTNFALIFVWAVINLVWQMVRWNPTMRYLLPIYPVLAIGCAYFMKTVGDWLGDTHNSLSFRNAFKVFVVVIVLLGTFLWASAFLNIYRQRMTRIAASEWIYKNINGPVNLILLGEEGENTHPIPFPRHMVLDANQSIEFVYSPSIEGMVDGLLLDGIKYDESQGNLSEVKVSIRGKSSKTKFVETDLSLGQKEGDASSSQVFRLDNFSSFFIDHNEEIVIVLNNESQIPLTITDDILINFPSENRNMSFDLSVFSPGREIRTGEIIEFQYSPSEQTQLTGLLLNNLRLFGDAESEINVRIEIVDQSENMILNQKSFTTNFSRKGEDYEEDFRLDFNEIISLDVKNTYLIKIVNQSENASFTINGSAIAKETDWDDALPLSMLGLNPHDPYQGVFQTDLNFQMYWDDNPEKLSRFIELLDKADYIIISSSRQWGSVTQIPERFPLSSQFYRDLIGCPYEDVQKCYENAAPGMYVGVLGYDLVKTFQANPRLFNLEFNSQRAEEAFTVYDHPKVMVFKKNNDFDLESAAKKLGSVNLGEVINLSPSEADRHPGKLLLSRSQFRAQKEGGTWSTLFSFHGYQNRNQLSSVIIWYFFFVFVGWIFYPTSRIIFKFLPDKGFSLSKLLGLIIWVYPAWLLSSLGLNFTNVMIGMVGFALALGNYFLFLRNKSDIRDEIKTNFRKILYIETLFLLFFLLFLAIRLGNPDLWHPYKGGEKPLDFAYFNAVLKSKQFPPYDPWYAGGYINYYYYGFTLAALPTRFLGIIPSVAYNLILPTFFAFTAMSAFSVGLFFASRSRDGKKLNDENAIMQKEFSQLLQATIFPIFVLVIGNLGTIQMVLVGLVKIGERSGTPIEPGFFSQMLFFFKGIWGLINGAKFQFYPGDWYWIPSRTIPGEPITEFPFFTFLYGDPHAHLFAYPITLLAINWCFYLFEKLPRATLFEKLFSFFTGALIIGTLLATNTWDYPTFLGLASLSILIALLEQKSETKTMKKVAHAILVITVFIFGSFLLFSPYTKWYGQAYSSIALWEGSKTPISSYLIHWGLFFFIVTSWVYKELIAWMAITPISKLGPIYHHRKHLFFVFSLIFLGIVLLFIWGVRISVLVVPLLLSLAILYSKRNALLQKKVAMIFSVIGLALTLMVEIVVLKGDIGRMNTVFKFYLQAWTFLALSSAFFLIDILKDLNVTPLSAFQKTWRVVLAILIGFGLLFPIFGGADKITDRISQETPLTLDGMEYMRSSTYQEGETTLELERDYVVIRWIQENVKGTPVILEANLPEYRWGNRYSIYTGLPTVIGWNWHQRQQRAINPSEWIFQRVEDVSNFYNSEDLEVAKNIINKYDVDYFVIGQLEQAVYERTGLEKFTSETKIWEPIFEYKGTILYKVKSGML